MKPIVRTTVALLCAFCSMLAVSTVQAHGCSVAAIRLGLIDQEECRLDPQDLLRGYEMYKARQNGLFKYEVKVYTPPKKPNLVPYNINEGNGGGNTVMDARVHVRNTGTADAAAFFDVEVRVEFVKLDDNSSTFSQPVTLRMYTLPAGASAASDWLRSVSYILIPDPDPDDDAIITATVDPTNRIDESNETDNVLTEVCRIPGYGEGQARPLEAGEDYC